MYSNTLSQSTKNIRCNNIIIDGNLEIKGGIIPPIPVDPAELEASLNQSNIDPNNGLVNVYGLTREFNPGNQVEPILIINDNNAADSFYYSQGQAPNERQIKMTQAGDFYIAATQSDINTSGASNITSQAEVTINADAQLTLRANQPNNTIVLEAIEQGGQIEATSTSHLTLQSDEGQLRLNAGRVDYGVGLNIDLPRSSLEQIQALYSSKTTNAAAVGAQNIAEVCSNNNTFKKDWIYNPANLKAIRGEVDTYAGINIVNGLLVNDFDPDNPIDFQNPNDFTDYGACLISANDASLQSKVDGVGTAEFRVFGGNSFQANIIANPNAPINPKGLYIETNDNTLWHTNQPPVFALNPVGLGQNTINNDGAGNYTHKAFSSPSGSVAVTADTDNIFLEGAAMTPSVFGNIYGNQSTEDNIIGYNNQAAFGSGQRSNIIGSNLPAFNTDESNIMCSYQNLASASNTYSRSNIILCGDSSEINSSTNSHIVAENLNAGGLDMNNCVYIGDMRQTTPADVSVCINNNLYGNNIQMAKESVYIGCGQNPITLNNNECHLDFRCPKLFYHDLGGLTTADTVYYDSTNGELGYGPATAGPAGPPGAQGNTGPTGPPGVTSISMARNTTAGSYPILATAVTGGAITGTSFSINDIWPATGLFFSQTSVTGPIGLSTQLYNPAFSLGLAANLVTSAGANIIDNFSTGMTGNFNSGSMTLANGQFFLSQTQGGIVSCSLSLQAVNSSVADPTSIRLYLYNNTTSTTVFERFIVITNGYKQNYSFTEFTGMNNLTTYTFRMDVTLDSSLVPPVLYADSTRFTYQRLR